MQNKNQKILDEIRAFQNAMDGENGRIILEHLEKLCFVNKTTFGGTGVDIAYREGMRNVYLLIKNELNMPIAEMMETFKEKDNTNVLD